MSKRKLHDSTHTRASPPFRERSIAVDGSIETLCDGVKLRTPDIDDHNNKESKEVVIMPWMGYGTYRLGKEVVQDAVLQALECGYRSIDTAFIYGGETTERLVGEAIQKAVQMGIINDRSDVFLTTKHWRKYHGYDATFECLQLSLSRLQVEYLDLWLMHWPGPAWKTISRKKEQLETDLWHYATADADEIVALRSETWRAMEDAYKKGLVRAIGVSNMTEKHLQTLKETATIWPPAVNQVELHPLYPQTGLLEYCRQEGIVVQAYASLGGQDTGKDAWRKLLDDGKPRKRKEKLDLLHSAPVLDLAQQLNATPAQVLLRWALERGCAVIPKSASKERMMENAASIHVPMTKLQADQLQQDLLEIVRRNNQEQKGNLEQLTRLCWRSDPLRQLDFD